VSGNNFSDPASGLHIGENIFLGFLPFPPVAWHSPITDIFNYTPHTFPHKICRPYSNYFDSLQRFPLGK